MHASCKDLKVCTADSPKISLPDSTLIVGFALPRRLSEPLVSKECETLVKFCRQVRTRSTRDGIIRHFRTWKKINRGDPPGTRLSSIASPSRIYDHHHRFLPFAPCCTGEDRSAYICFNSVGTRSTALWSSWLDPPAGTVKNSSGRRQKVSLATRKSQETSLHKWRWQRRPCKCET